MNLKVLLILVAFFGSLSGCGRSPLDAGTSIEVTDRFGAHYVFYKDQDKYYYQIRHSDKSGGTYELRKSGMKYYDTNARRGEFYIINDDSIDLYDNQGFIRTL